MSDADRVGGWADTFKVIQESNDRLLNDMRRYGYTPEQIHEAMMKQWDMTRDVTDVMKGSLEIEKPPGFWRRVGQGIKRAWDWITGAA
jgi:hypothetical protein